MPTPVGKPGSAGDGSAVAASGNLAWAGGTYCPGCTSGNPGNLPFILRWTGSAWKVTPVPTKNIAIRGLAVTSATNAWAIGNANTSSKGIILHWNGSAWH